jgi:hypothetical protein
MEEISKLEWLILGSLSNDTECVACIWPDMKESMPSITGYELKDVIYSLYKRGLIYIASETEPVDREDVLAEEITNEYSTGNYYFGLTSKGVEVWEKATEKYDEPVDWSKSWTANHDLERREGHIDGTSREVCLNRLKAWNENGYGEFKEWQVDMDSLIHSEIKGFQAKYYRYISGGHRISFKLKRR